MGMNQETGKILGDSHFWVPFVVLLVGIALLVALS